MECLQSEETVAAAWQDTLAIFKDAESDPEVCEARILQLAELAEYRGVDYKAWANTAGRVIANNAATLAELGAAVTLDPEAAHRAAELSEEERIRFCGIALVGLR